MIRDLARSKFDMLGELALTRLLGAIDSLEGLHEWVVGSMQSADAAPYTVDSIMQQVGEPIQYADMCVNTLFLVLSDQITDWEPDALPILATAADHYMTLVEDVFLSRSVASGAGGPAIHYDSLRQERLY